MKKNPFKKKGITDTLTNVGIGGAANVAIDYAVSKVDALSSLDATTLNAIKIGVGVLGGTMTTNKFIQAAVHGVATVGVSNLVQGLLDETATGTDTGTSTTSGLAKGTIGVIRPGNPYYRRPIRKRSVAGVGSNGFMGK